MNGYRTPDVKVGTEAALKRLDSAARRDGYAMSASVILTDTRAGTKQFIAYVDGSWYEHVGLFGGDAE